MHAWFELFFHNKLILLEPIRITENNDFDTADIHRLFKSLDFNNEIYKDSICNEDIKQFFMLYCYFGSFFKHC